MSRPPSISSNNGVALPTPSQYPRSPYQERAETYQQLELTQKRKSQSETELQSLVRIRSTTPNMSPMEINRKDKEIDSLTQRIQLLNYQIHEMMQTLEKKETVIAQQQVTIRNQSKAIENPHGRSSIVTSSPHRPVVVGQQRYPTDGRKHHGGPYGVDRLGEDQINWPSQFPASQPTIAPAPFSASSLYSQESFLGGIPAQAPMSRLNGRHPSLHGATEYGSPEPHRSSIATTPEHRSKLSEASTDMSSIQATPSRESNPFGPIAPPSGGRFNAHAPAFHPSQDEPYLSIPARPGSNPYPETAIVSSTQALTLVDKLGSKDALIADQFDRVFASSKNWAFNHANVPNTCGDNALNPTLKNRIIHAASMQTAFPLMKNPESRYWLVTKIMILYIIKHILRLNTFSGLDREADQCIDGLRQTIYQSTPSQLRYVILKNISEKTQVIVNNPKFDEYVEHLTKQRAEKLFWDVRSLKHQATLRDQEDIILLVREAHKLAVMINTSTNEFAFNWADIGDRFDCFSMNNVCPRYGGFSDNELRQKWATVRLCACPEVVVRKNSPQGQVTEVKLHRARVLLKVKGEE